MQRNDITAKYEEEKLRVQEQSQLIYLQNQIDELRRVIKEQNNKYAWAMEQVRRVEGMNAQLQGMIDKHAQDQQLVLEGYKRELSSLRRDIANALVRAEDGVKPIREIQVSLHQLTESRRADREYVAPLFNRIDELERRERELAAQVRETDDRHRTVMMQIDQLRQVDDEVDAELRALNDDIQAEKQALRRQAVEAQQMVSDARTALHEPVARITYLEDAHKQLVALVNTLPGGIEGVAEQLPQIKDELRRLEILSTQRFMMNQERLEELRHVHEERYVELRDADDDQLRRISGRLDRLDGWCREEEGRVARIANRLDLLHQRHESRLADLEAQDLDVLQRLSSAWSGLLEARRAANVERGAADIEPDEAEA